jgi:hypothetical protein
MLGLAILFAVVGLTPAQAQACRGIEVQATGYGSERFQRFIEQALLNMGAQPYRRISWTSPSPCMTMRVSLVRTAYVRVDQGESLFVPGGLFDRILGQNGGNEKFRRLLEMLHYFSQQNTGGTVIKFEANAELIASSGLLQFSGTQEAVAVTAANQSSVIVVGGYTTQYQASSEYDIDMQTLQLLATELVKSARQKCGCI